MMITHDKKKLGRLLLILTVLVMIAVPSFGATVNLVALEASKTMPDGVVVPMWGYFEDTGQACTDTPAWTSGPVINVPAGDTTLQINLRNCLSEGTSVVVTGLGLPQNGSGNPLAPVTFTDPQGRTRVSSFTAVTASSGTTSYNWNNVTSGTYLYKSGTHPARQVQMGLYGAVINDSGADEIYAGVSYDQAHVLLYSEVDPALHAPVGNARPLNYRPKYFLVNGEPFSSTAMALSAGAVGSTTLLRFLNAGLKDHTPTINSGHLQVIAEDGNAYPYPLTQYTLNLAAGKTMDALLMPTANGTYTVFDRALHLTNNGMTGGGLVTQLSVTDPGTLPIASAGSDQSGLLVGQAYFLDGSGSDAGVTYSWAIESAPQGSTATLSDPAIVNPSFTPDLAGSYQFQLVVNDGVADSVPDTVLVSTQLQPVADAGMDADVGVGELVTLDGSGSVDPDSYPAALTYSWALTMVPDGSTASLAGADTASPSFTADLAGTYVAELIVSDTNLASDPDSVIINGGVTINDPPLALDDVAETTLNTDSAPIDVLGNDSDSDGTLIPTTVTIVSNPTRGGSVVVNPDGTVTFTPRRGFRGTDTFTYTVNDDGGSTSNVATVIVNVVK